MGPAATPDPHTWNLGHFTKQIMGRKLGTVSSLPSPVLSAVLYYPWEGAQTTKGTQSLERQKNDGWLVCSPAGFIRTLKCFYPA